MPSDRLTNLFEEYLTIYKLVNRKAVAEILTTELSTPQLIKIYELTDGSRSTRETASIIGKVSHATIANVWKKWALVGIVLSTDKKGRYKAAFNLNDYGISSNEEEE